MKKTFPVTAAAAVVSLWTLAVAAHAAPAPVTQTYDRPGSYTFTVPDGVRRITEAAEAVGATTTGR
ncbi:hypothetical protein VR44_36500 [Streptomyces katrae]|uniref:Uncharacterized protein n=1 Tax=Streptomyces katrae TaxID=68223 RepID=A0A0F4IQV2_9ACTN|nr:hypothetical protein VR44_36500 [Streptomyces katrae]